MKYIKRFNESDNFEVPLLFKHKMNSRLDFTVYKSRDGRITRIENCNFRFPFSVGQFIQRNIEDWACNNNFLIDGVDPCPEEKVFGIKVSDIPKGHDLRRIYPNKFR
jgi:hypothetical protein